MKEIEKTITDYLDKEYKDYAKYVLESRAIPSLIDSFKPVQRKVIFSALKNAKDDYIRVSELGGSIISECKYHHGSASAESCIILLTADYKNNLPLFDCDSQCGSLRAPEAPAARYIDVKLSSNFDLIYKDNDLLIQREDDGKKIEPYYYLPIVPTILFNSGSSGIAIGHATYIANRNPLDVVQACIDVLYDRPIKKIRRYINGFKGKFINDETNPKKWICEGSFIRNEQTGTVTITEIVPSFTYEKMEELLDELVENKEIISYENLGKGEIKYVCKIGKEKLSSMSDEDIIKIFKLRESEVENYTCLDEHGKLKIFDSVDDIIKYFVNFRLVYYQKRKDKNIKEIEKKLNILSQKARFIKLVVEGEIVLSKRTKIEIEKDLIKLMFDKIDGSFDYLLDMNLYSLTKEKIKILEEDVLKKKKELKELKESEPKKTYLKELEELKEKIEKKYGHFFI